MLLLPVRLHGFLLAVLLLQTNSIISTNREVYTSIDRNMELVNDVFGISIPSSEIARLSEIFVDLINGCEQEECRTGID